jgi:hypothetical protein
MRSFDPRAVGRWECRAWETYYQRRWAAFLVASVMLVRSAFRMGWRDTLVGAWLVLRANQEWAPFPDNDPEEARRLMTRFYGLLGLPDARRAAEIEVEWWRVHREHQHGGAERSELDDALAAIYSYTYGVDPDSVRDAAAMRARAMDISDEWVAGGSKPGDPRLAEERELLVRSYASLLAAVYSVSASALPASP